MSRKTNHYTHFGVSFTSPKPPHITLESFIERGTKQTSDSFFWTMRYKCQFKLFDKEPMLEYFNGLFAEVPKIKEKSERNGEMVEYWCNLAFDFFNGDYEKEQFEYRQAKYNEIDPKHEKTFEYFLNNIPIILENKKSNFDWSNGSYFRPWYSEKYLLEEDEDLKKNFEINMKHFELLKKEDFDVAIEKFQKEYSFFKEVHDLSDSSLQAPGYYVLVLDNYKQVYVGQASNIAERIIQHWHLNKSRSRRIFGGVDCSKISIDSFGPLDTTRIFVSVDELVTMFPSCSHEDELINAFDNKYVTNRVMGGELPIGIDGVEPKKISN